MNVDYRVDTIKFENLMGQIVIPRFQRGQVWVEDKRKAFIRAILNGYPFGSLLLYKNEQSIESKYSLIDGLQRYSTLKRFYDNPKDFVYPSEFCKDDIKKIIELVKKGKVLISSQDVEKEIKIAINEEFSFKKEVRVIVADIISHIPFVKENEIMLDIQLILVDLVSELFSKLNVMDLPIPIVIYSGDFNKLPDIFENVNTSGTKLTRYDMFAARWVDYALKVDDMDILVSVEEKYKRAMENTESEIEGYRENDIIISKEINLFEFCFALGINLKKKFPIIFGGDVIKVGKSKDKEEVEAIGFSLLAAILNNSPQNPDGLHKHLCGENAVNIKKLIDSIVYSVKVAQDIIQPYITDFGGRYIGKYSEYQVISLISTVFKIKYSVVDCNIVDNNSIKHLMDKVKSNCPGRFLYDSITNYWSGTDGSRVGDELQKEIQYNRYLVPVSDDEWNITLSSWMGEQCNKPMKQKDKNSVVFINYILKLGGYSPKPNEKLEIDLIIPKKRFISTFNYKAGLCAIGNLALIPEFENRSKSDKTLYEQANETLSLFWLKDDTLEKLLYPPENEISFIRSQETFTYDKYLMFIRDRHNYLQRKFVELIKTL